MKANYIEEKFPRWFIFGRQKEKVDVSDTNGKIVSNIKKQEAQKMIDEHNKVIDALVNIAIIHPETYYQILKK